VSGRGHRAALPEGGHARPEYLVADGQAGLVVWHHNREGRVREYDFAQLPVPAPMRASLAALFAARCTPDRWSAHLTSKATWKRLRQFTAFLAAQEPVPRDLDELTPRMMRQWRASLPAGQGGHRDFRTVSGLLRDDGRLQAGPVADELARRRKEPRSSTQSFGEADFDKVTAAARRGFRAALQRINDNAGHLRQWRDGEFAEGSRDWVIGEGLDSIARNGDLPRCVPREDGRAGAIDARYRNAFGPGSPVAWQRLFLTREEAVALGILLLAEFGWNLSVISTMEVPAASPDQGADGHPTYRIPLEKRRRGPGRHHETRNVTDHGAGSPGRLITQALEATRFARAAVTVIALDRREPGQHSQDSHDRHYVLPDERVRAEAAGVIAAGVQDAASRARRVVLAAELRDRPGPGDAETATADCSGYRDSPWPGPGGSCGASFLLCLACPNARVHPGHHPRLAYLHEALASLRPVLTPAAWAADWRDAHDRLEDLKERIGDAPWAQARRQVTEADREIVSHLLTGNLGA
jgi:hypothetical protein